VTIRLTRDDLLHIAPRPKIAAKAAVWDAYVSALMSPEASALFDRYQINTPRRMQHFLATVVAETNFSVLWESGAYSAASIIRVFGAGHHSSAVSQAEAARIAALPVGGDVPGNGPRGDALFERVYGYKTKIGKSLGNREQGDGAKYRGLGPLQITGRDAHERYAARVGCSVADLGQPLNCLHAALCEWQEKNCNKYADNDDAVSIRKLINGGSLSVSVSKINGLPNAMAALRLAKAVITAVDFSDAAVASVPANEDKPASLYSSTEMQAAAGGGMTSGAMASNSWLSCLPRAFGAATATGRFSIVAFLFALASDPEFWASVAATLATGGCIYLMIMRFKRFHIFGV